MYTLLLLLIYLAFISLGLPDSLLGSAWPVMHKAFQVPLSYAGLVTMIISVGTICSSLMSERLTKKFGTQIVTVFSVMLTAIALFGFSTASAFWMLCLWAVPYGLGAGAIDAALNNYVALHYNSRHMSWLHCFWGLGTIISPYVMSYALTTSVWQNGYRMVSFIQIGIALILFVTLPIWKVNKKETAQEEKAEEEVVGIKGALKIKGVPNLLLGFCTGISSDSVGKQLSGRSKGNLCGTCSSLCVPVLHRYHTWKISGKLYYRENGRPQDDSSGHRYHSCWMYRYVVTGIHR